MLSHKKTIQKTVNANKKPSKQHQEPTALALIKNLIPLFPGIPGNPLSIHFFDQIPLLTKSWLQSKTYFWRHQPALNPQGICFALLLIWYDKLRRGENIFDDMFHGQLKSEYIDYINKVQSKSSGSFIVHKNESTDGRTVPTSSTQYYCDDICNNMGFFDCAYGESTHFLHEHTKQNQIQYLQEYFDKLENAHQNIVGLHTLSYYLPGMGAHTTGWTALADKYLFVDANLGELLFNSFDDLKDCIFDKFYMLLVKSPFLSITTLCLYFQEDLDAIEELNAMKRLQFSFS